MNLTLPLVTLMSVVNCRRWFTHLKGIVRIIATLGCLYLLSTQYVSIARAQAPEGSTADPEPRPPNADAKPKTQTPSAKVANGPKPTDSDNADDAVQPEAEAGPSDESSEGSAGTELAEEAAPALAGGKTLPAAEKELTEAERQQEQARAAREAAMSSIPPTDLEAAEGLPIRRLDIAGVRRIAPTDVRGYMRQKIGDPLSASELKRDVRELWRSGYFDDIEVDLRLFSDGVNLRFLVKERPAIRAVIFEGNSEIDEDDFSEALEVKPETTLSRPALRRALQKIRDMYAERGYFLAEAEFEVKTERNNEVDIIFKITEHAQVSVKRVTFIGNSAISTKELKDSMITGNPGFMAFGAGGPFRQDAFERDMAIISSLYYDRGFLQVAVHTPRVMLTPDKDGIEVSVTIDEGPRFRIRQLRVFEQGADGKEVKPLRGRRALRLMVRAESGDYFNRAQLLEDLGAIRAVYRDAGYATVMAEPQTAVDAAKQEVDVIVPIARGPVVYFQRIEIRGNTKTRDQVIRRQLEIIEGQKYSETALNRSRRRVTALGYFERVDFSTEQGSALDQLIVYVDVTEKPTGTFQVGAGFSSIESFIATAQVQQDNLFGNGQSLALQAQLSGIRQAVDLRLSDRYFLDTRFSATVRVYDQLRVYTDFAQQSRGGSFTLGYPLIEPELLLSLTYTAQLDEVSTSQGSTLLGGTSSRTSNFSQLPLANLFNDGLTSSLTPNISYDTRNNRLAPSSGVFLNLSSEWATSVLGSKNQFIRNTWQGRFYVPVKWGAVLKLNTNAGMVTSPSAEGVPIFARFFIGGILDLRGYRYRTVGPRMPLTRTTDPNSPPITNGANIGGNLMYYQNLEFEFPIFEQVGLKGVIFTDLGNAWNLEGNYCDAAGGAESDSTFKAVSPCFTPKDIFNVRTSWGFGFRWFSPLGPLRFEWGFPFKPLPYEEPLVFEFTIGNFF